MKKLTLKSFGKVALVYLVGLVSLEFLGQGLIRYLESRRPSDVPTENMLSPSEPVLGFGMKRDFLEKYPQWTVETNRWGFRDAELSREKAKDEFRVFVLGGSTVFGWALDAEHSIPARIQRLANAHFPPASGKYVRVINAGMPWFASWHEAALVFFRVMELKPDWIVVLDGLNDTAMSLSSNWSRIDEGFLDAPTRAAAEKKARSSKSPALNLLLDLSPTLRYFHARAQQKEQLKVGTYRPEAWDQYLGYMHRLNALCKSQGVKFSLLFQPVMMVDKPLDYFETEHNGTSTREPQFAETFRKQYQEGERRLLVAKELPFRSLRALFLSHPEPLYLDGLHYNVRGNDLIAQDIFFKTLEPELKPLLHSPLS